jgi:hypothetical protein
MSHAEGMAHATDGRRDHSAYGTADENDFDSDVLTAKRRYKRLQLAALAAAALFIATLCSTLFEVREEKYPL